MMIYEGIDLSEWDTRTRDVVGKWGDLPQDRYDGWMGLYKGNAEQVEREYLKHIGMHVFNQGSDSIRHDPQKALELYQEAKGIFDLLLELGPMFWKNTREYIGHSDRHISYLEDRI